MARKTDHPGNNGSQGKNGDDSTEPRRRLLKTVAAGGTALGLTALPGKWAKPIVASVVLPAHAQTSPEDGECCDLELVERDTEPTTALAKYSFTSIPGIGTEVSDGTTFLDGTASDTLLIGSFDGCPPGCGDDGNKYVAATLGFDGDGEKYLRFENVARCDGDIVFRKYYEFNGTRSGADGTTITYTGDGTYQVESCEDVDLGALRRDARSLRERFRFGR